MKGGIPVKIERISESQIRCTLSDFDLSERNMNLSELAYGSAKAQRLFSEMLQQANTQVGFDAEDLPIMVEAIPLSNQSVMLVITKVDDPEEMDTRYSRFAPPPEGLFYPGVTDEQDPGLERAELVRPKAKAPGEDGGEDPSEPVRIRAYVFQNLDRVIEAAKSVQESSGVSDRLYKNPADGTYYLVLKDSGTDPAAFASLCNRLADYGTRARQHYSGDSYYQEHFEIILKERVLASLKLIG